MNRHAPFEPLARLRVLATSDLHCQIFPWDYLSDRVEPGRGLARTATLIARARAEVETCLLLDNGDFIQGSPLGDLMAASGSQTIHPMIAAMNHLRYDAATLGNHEFSHGLPFLERVLQDAAFPVVSANVLHSDGDRPFRPPFAVLTRTLTVAGQPQTLRIGVVGFAPPQLEQWDHQHIAGHIKARDILATAAEQVPLLRAAGADLVIALSHSGLGPEQAQPDMEDATTALAAEAGIDLLIAGHTHQTFPSKSMGSGGAIDARNGRLHGKPAVMPGFFGSHLGLIDLWLSFAQGQWCIARHRSALRAISYRSALGRKVARVRSDPAIERLAATAHADTLHWARQIVGHNPLALQSFFALVQPCPTVRLVAQAQARHVIRRLHGTPWEGLPVLSAAAPFRAGGRGGAENYTRIAAGPVAIRHVMDLYIHPNTVTAILVTGAELTRWLERSAGLFHRILPGLPDQPLINDSFPSFNFDCIEGVTYRIDLATAPHHDLNGRQGTCGTCRITDLQFEGRPVAPDARFVLATNSYRTGGSGQFPGAEPGRVILPGITLTRDVVQAHVQSQGLDLSRTAPNWQFVAMPGTSVVFDSAPAAVEVLGDLCGAQVEPLALTPEGFQRFRLHL